MLKHLLKNHFSKWDYLFLVFALVMIGFSIHLGEYWDIVIWIFFITFIFVINISNMTLKHQRGLIEKLLELVELQNKVLGGGKIVETTTHEFSIERVSKKGKSNGKSSEDSNKSRGSGSKSRRSPATANSKGTRPASVQNRKPKTAKKNS